MPKVDINKYIPSEDKIDFNTIKLIRPIKTNLKKIGTSVGFIIPQKVAEYLQLQVGDEVNLYVEKKGD